MLSVARDHRMKRMEGFRLIAPQERWERFWVIEFPTLEGAEAWIEAEMAPPYGSLRFLRVLPIASVPDPGTLHLDHPPPSSYPCAAAGGSPPGSFSGGRSQQYRGAAVRTMAAGIRGGRTRRSR